MSSLSQTDGVVRVVFATMALGMGIDFKSLDYIVLGPWQCLPDPIFCPRNFNIKIGPGD